MLIYLPIEGMEQRYTKMQNDVVAPLVDHMLHP